MQLRLIHHHAAKLCQRPATGERGFCKLLQRAEANGCATTGQRHDLAAAQLEGGQRRAKVVRDLRGPPPRVFRGPLEGSVDPDVVDALPHTLFEDGQALVRVHLDQDRRKHTSASGHDQYELVADDGGRPLRVRHHQKLEVDQCHVDEDAGQSNAPLQVASRKNGRGKPRNNQYPRRRSNDRRQRLHGFAFLNPQAWRVPQE